MDEDPILIQVNAKDYSDAHYPIIEENLIAAVVIVPITCCAAPGSRPLVITNPLLIQPDSITSPQFPLSKNIQTPPSPLSPPPVHSLPPGTPRTPTTHSPRGNANPMM
jgi:hypothetical protein